MGHLINPISLRLGKTKIWNSQWVFFNKNNFLNLFVEEIILYKLIYRLCFDKVHIRNGLVFSHFVIIRRNNYINLIIYLYNSILQYDIHFLNRLKYFNIKGKGNIDKKNKFNKIKKVLYLFKVILEVFYNKSNYIYYKYKIMKYLYITKGKLFFSLFLNKKLSFINKNNFLFNKSIIYKFYIYFNFLIKYFKLNSTLDFSYKFYNVNNENKIDYKLNYIKIKNSLKIKNKIKFMQTKSFFQVKKLLIIYFNFLTYLNILKKIFKYKLLNKKFQFNSIYFCLLDIYSFNANIISNLIVIRLNQRYQLRNILNLIIRIINTVNDIKGFRVKCSGRFTKKQRSDTFYFSSFKSEIPLSTIKFNIDYSFREVTLKYGRCGIKVWLFRDSRNSVGTVVSKKIVSSNKVTLIYDQNNLKKLIII